MVNALEAALDQEVFPQQEEAPWGSMEEGGRHDKVACQVEGALALPWVQDLQRNNKMFSLMTLSLCACLANYFSQHCVVPAYKGLSVMVIHQAQKILSKMLNPKLSKL